MTYGVVWIILLNVLLLYTIFLCKANGSREHVQRPLMSPHPWGEFQAHSFHVVPSMGPIVSVINLQGRQKSL